MINIDVVHVADGYICSENVMHAPSKGEFIYLNYNTYIVLSVTWEFTSSASAKIIVEEYSE